MFIIRKKFTFEAAHQLETAYTTACSDCVHGHSYTVEMILSSHALDPMGMVTDFGRLKPFKNMVMQRWDHGLILHKDKQEWYQPLCDAGVLKESKVHFLDVNPTAEHLARILFRWLTKFIKTTIACGGLRVEAVRVHETSTGWGEWREDGPTN